MFQMPTHPTPARTALRSLALATALALGTIAMPTAAQSVTAPAQVSSNGTLLSISAHSEVTRTPDIAHLSTGVLTRAADAKVAMAANAEQMSKVIAAIHEAGIAKRDVQTSGVNLNPQYHYSDNQPPAITGYEARNTVNITVRDIGELGKIMDALVAVGANQIHGPSFEVDDKEAAYNQARREALEKAQARAQIYAKTLDMQVRRIVSISEGNHGFNTPRPMMAMARMEASDAAASTPIAPGESTLSIDLDVVFELGR